MPAKRPEDSSFARRVSDYVSTHSRRYRALLAHRPSILNDIPETVTDLELELELCKHQFQFDAELRRDARRNIERDAVALAHLHDYFRRRPTATVKEHGPPSGPLILCVDDYADAREMYSAYLAHSGFRVHEAHDGIHTLHLMTQNAYDLVLLDLAMPGLDGWTVLRILRRLGSNIPVIIVTGHALADSNAQVYRADPDAGFITKPCLPETILEAVRNKLAGRPQPRVDVTSPASHDAEATAGRSDKLSKALAQVVGGACHDLANSLSVAIADSPQRGASRRGTNAKRALHRAFETVEELHRFVGSFYRPQGAILRRVGFTDLQTHLAGVLQSLAPSDNLQVDVRVDCERPGVTVSSMLVELVVVPLVVNSMEALHAFERQMHPRIQVSVVGRPELDELAILVTDNGPGFGHLLQHIRTTALDARLPSKKGKARGYGLVHLMRLAKQLGGSTEFRDVSPVGAVADVRLPLDV